MTLQKKKKEKELENIEKKEEKRKFDRHNLNIITDAPAIRRRT